MGSNADSNVQEEAIDKLNQEAWIYRVQDSARSHLLSKSAVDLAEAINYTKGKADGYRSLGFSYIRLSRHQEAHPFLEASLQLYEEMKDLQGQSDIYEYLGIIKRSLGDYSASLKFLFRSLDLRKHTSYSEGESLSLYHLGVTYKYLGEYDKALNNLLEGLSIAKRISYWVVESYALNIIGQVYYETGAFNKALEYYHQSLAIRKEAGDKWGEAGGLDNIGFTYFQIKDFHKALDYCTASLSISETIDDKKGQSNALFHLGNVHLALNNNEEASVCGNKSLDIRRDIGDKKGEAETLLFLVELQNLNEQGKEISTGFLDKALQLGTALNALDLLSKIHFRYYTLYKHYNCHKDALIHLELFLDIDKRLHKDALDERIQNLEISHKAEQSKNEAEIYRLRNIELAELVEESNRQKKEIEIQKRIVDEALVDLKLTQKQLIHSEKMASLGELTAGIAHEIQNPLNFINNFSEVNVELIDELNEEVNKGNFKEAIEISKDIKENEEKINHHGRRADAIVKGMLQHSRSSSAIKEPTDINKLADEYLRLAYHGLRAKDKSFNATLKTDYDNSIGNINVIPQDIGRVILNLITNAFYAVREKKDKQPGIRPDDFTARVYEPTVFVSTKRAGNNVAIKVQDNGNGISQKIVDKIFQPFFTTKPTGQGTGLGLSLAFDIVKAHGGELKVDTKEGEGSTFIMNIPILDKE